MPARRDALDAPRTLATRGLRATRQRTAVLLVLQQHGGHWTARAVHERLRRTHAGLSLKTIYQALDALVATGLAARVGRGDGPACYEAHRTRHYHALCRSCGELYDVPASADRALRRAALPMGFESEEIRVLIEGRCASCRTRRARRTQGKAPHSQRVGKETP